MASAFFEHEYPHSEFCVLPILKAPIANPQTTTCSPVIAYTITVVAELVRFAALMPHAYEMMVTRFIMNVTTDIPSSMKVGQRVAGVIHGCTLPEMTLFLVRKYFASAKERMPIIIALRMSDRKREMKRRIRMRFL